MKGFPFLVILLLAARSAGAQETAGTASEPAQPQLTEAEKKALSERLDKPPSGTVRIFATAAAGAGLRFNNPYRLQTQLGDDASSVSATPPYLDFALTVAGGPADFLQHGGSLHVGGSLDGVGQPFITPSYVLAYRSSLPVLLYGRLGTPVVLTPDVNVGGEVAASVSYFFNSGLGLTSELVFDLFYGAATLTQQYSVIPILSLQLGVIADYEFLP